MMAPLPREDHWGSSASAGGMRRCDRHHPGGDGGRCVGAGSPGDRHDCASCLGRPMERWCMRRRRRGHALAPAAGAAPSAAGHGGPPCGQSAALGGPSGCDRCLLGMDYEQDDGCTVENSCDSISSSGEGATSSLPTRLPRSRICGDDGPSEGGGAPDALRGAQDPACPSFAPLFLSADRRSGLTVTSSSSGRTGDGAAVHFPGKGRLPRSGAIDNPSADDAAGVGITGCGERGRRVRRSDAGGTSRALLLLVSLVWLSLGALLVDGASASIMGDGCDWSGSGLMAEMEVSREGGGVGVRPVYLRCSQGAVSWAYPRGALRVLLRLAGGGVDGEFRGCVRLGRTWKGARLFLEGPRSLHPLFPPGVEDGAAKGSGVRCFQSRKGQAALYVEATPGGVSPRGRTVASFEYHLQPLPSGVKSFDPSEECRPCTVEEMTHAFCSSDLVTRGTIRSVESHDDPETSELKVRVTKLIRRTRAPPPALEGDPFDEGELQEEAAAGDAPAKGDRAGRHWWDSADRGASVTLHVPTHCGARHGAGEFVFMAQRKLGQLRLRCAPRLEDWAELTRKTHRLAASPCVLQA
ncbi:meteorin-like protein [Hetaerina americana]|uniref:meteorin-like protein n=1 Tax=Hetaerina americana TaxID=62018 RepID=UPI003A7F21CB